MLYFGKFVPVPLLAFLLLASPAMSAGVQAELPDAAAAGSEASGIDEKQGTASELPPPVPRAAEPFASAFRTLLVDHKDIWLSPSKIGTQHLPWLLPVAGSAAVMTRFDTRVSGALPNSSDQFGVAKALSHAGAYYSLGPLTASFYVAGRLTGNARARETGILMAQALLHTESVVQMLKFAFGRERPDYGEQQGRFFSGQQSFPSGHAAGTWAAAAIISREYYDNKWLRYGIYALPLAVSAARIGAQRHYVSDVIAGALIGNLVGAFIYRRHHNPELGGAPVKPRSRAIPEPGVRIEPRSRTYALSLTWNP